MTPEIPASLPRPGESQEPTAGDMAVPAALGAAIPDAAVLVFACLGVALALQGRRAVRARRIRPSLPLWLRALVPASTRCSSAGRTGGMACASADRWKSVPCLMAR